MKTTYIFISVLLLTALGFAQNGINYKALIKDNNGNVVASQSVTVQFIIYEGDALSNNVYQENHTVNTDINGFIITNIGEGTTSDDFSTVRWSNDEHYLNVQVDIGSGLIDLGTTQFMAVPYALSSGDHPWTKNDNGIHTLNEDIGINRDNPEHTLDVRSMSLSEASQLNLSNSDKSRYIRFFSGSDTFPNPSITRAPGSHLLFATFDDSTLDFTEQMQINSSGNVGIGISNPEAKLDILGGDWNLDAGNSGDLRIGNSTHNLRIGVAIGGGGAGISRIYASNHLLFGVDNTSHMIIESDGETGFGTTNPSQKVHINGKLKIGDDEKAPSEGTIRYNSTNKSFEGYDGTKWINLGGSSPYGVQGTFNLPNSSFHPDVTGNPTRIKVVQDVMAIRSSEEVLAGYEATVPPTPIYEKVIYVTLFEKNTSSNWETKLTLSKQGGLFENNYAHDIALSESRLLIGDPSSKEVYEYTKVLGVNWLFTNTFVSPNTSIADRFGSSLEMYGGQTIIGAPAYSLIQGATGPGKAYVYDETDTLEGTLGGPGATLGDRFGSDVDISLNRAIVGAPGDSSGSISNAGSATVFNRLNGNWSSNNTFFDDTIEEGEGYGSSVTLIDADYFFIKDNEGIDSYLVENGFWALKETISGEGTGYTATAAKHNGHEKMVYYNSTSDNTKISYLVAAERDGNNFFASTSSIINGTSSIQSFDITNDSIYTLGLDDRVYVFEY